MTAVAPRKPLITANMVTMARLIPMPLLAYWIYTGQLWLGLVVGTIIGSTDFVDGYLARKHGPTVLGGLLDPIADKVFVALIYLPFADMGVIPAWAVALMFVREFLVTALRSAYEQRGLTMKTSYLGKVKTWTQMQGIGVLLLFPLVEDRTTIIWILGVGIAAPLVAMAILGIVKRKLWTGALVMSGSFVALLGVFLERPQYTGEFIMLLVVAMTWISGLDYMVGGTRTLFRRGDVRRADMVRIVGSIAIPVAVFLAVRGEGDAAAWPLLAILALELAAGGLDNLLSHHQQASGALAWGARVLGASALLAAAAFVPDHATLLAILAATVSAIGVAWEFWRGRDYYLDARLRDKAARGSGAAPISQSSG